MPKRSMYVLALCAIAVVSVAGFCILRARRANTVLRIDADKLTKTIVTPDLGQEISGGRNVVWCASFQLAWNQLRRLQWGRSLGRSAMAKALDRCSVTEADVPDGSCVSAAGAGTEDFVRSLSERLSATFGKDAPTVPAELCGVSGPVAYACLIRTLRFSTAFARDPSTLHFGGQAVRCFGVSDDAVIEPQDLKRMVDQVTLLDTRDADIVYDDFIVELKTTSDADRLILAQVKPGRTLESTVDLVLQRIRKGKPQPMSVGDTLLVPMIDFDITRRYHELETAGDTDCAVQSIRFCLNENGASLRSVGYIEYGITPRALVFQRPFLVMLMKRGANRPYLAMWIANPELLAHRG